MVLKNLGGFDLMNDHLIESQIHTKPYKMTLQPQLLKKEQLNSLNKNIHFIYSVFIYASITQYEKIEVKNNKIYKL